MLPQEKSRVKKVLNRAFPLLMRLFFYFTKTVLIAVEDDKILGGVVVKKFKIDKKRTGGLICLIFTDPEEVGRGIGQRVAEAGIEKLEAMGATDIFAMVLGDNTSSSKLFSNRGFKILNPLSQFRSYGIRTLLLWFKTLHFFDVGHFMWTKSTTLKEVSNPNRFISFLWTLGLHFIAGFIAVWRWYGRVDLKMTLVFIISIGVLLSIRQGLSLLVPRLKGVDVVYRPWESGLSLNMIISGIFGGSVPSPGSFYPLRENWSYRDTVSFTGLMALIPSIAIVSITVALWILKVNYTVLSIPYYIGFTLSVVDISLPFFPLSSYNGRRIWDWNRIIWLITALPIIFIFIKGLL